MAQGIVSDPVKSKAQTSRGLLMGETPSGDKMKCSRCKREAMEGSSLCEPCRTSLKRYKRRIYEARKAEHICVVCGKAEAVYNPKTDHWCVECGRCQEK